MNVFLNIRFSVRLGEHNTSSTLDCDFKNDNSTCNNDDPPIQDIEIDKIIIHEEYDRVTKIHDIALLRLEYDAILIEMHYVGTVCLPVLPTQAIENMKVDSKEDKTMIISGWGSTEKSQLMSDVLLMATVSYIPHDECLENFKTLKAKYSNINIDIKDTHLVSSFHSIFSRH